MTPTITKHPPLSVHRDGDNGDFRLEQDGWGIVARVESTSDFEHFPYMLAASAEMLEALKRVRQAFYVDGTSKALRAAFEGTKELVAKAEGRATA